jgi:hypothetical protein
MLKLSALLGSVVLCAGPVCAAFSGLTLIPTADVMDPGQVCVDYQVDGPFPVGSGPEAVLLNTQYGVGSRVEVGIDFDLSEGAPTGAVFNGKLALLPVETGLGVAVGSFNAGEHLVPTTYGVATLDLGRLRCHLGVQDSPEETGVLSGLDVSVSEQLQLWAEHISGDEGASALSLSYQFGPRWGISLAWQDPNEAGADNSYSIHAGCVLPSD